MINCEVDLYLSLAKDRVLIEHHNNIIGANFKITITKLLVPVVTFSIINYIEFLEDLKQGFKRTIPGNKNRSRQPKNNNLSYI